MSAVPGQHTGAVRPAQPILALHPAAYGAHAPRRAQLPRDPEAQRHVRHGRTLRAVLVGAFAALSFLIAFVVEYFFMKWKYRNDHRTSSQPRKKNILRNTRTLKVYIRRDRTVGWVCYTGSLLVFHSLFSLSDAFQPACASLCHSLFYSVWISLWTLRGSETILSSLTKSCATACFCMLRFLYPFKCTYMLGGKCIGIFSAFMAFVYPSVHLFSQPYIYKLHSFIMALTPTVHPVLFFDTYHVMFTFCLYVTARITTILLRNTKYCYHRSKAVAKPPAFKLPKQVAIQVWFKVMLLLFIFPTNGIGYLIYRDININL